MKIKIEQNMDMSRYNKEFLEKHKADLFDKNEPILSEYAIVLPPEFVFFNCIEMTHMILSSDEYFINDTCKYRGHVFLNEVYDKLNVPRTKAGQVMGWFYDKKKDKTPPIEFILYIDGDAMMLDFNVEGNIYDIFDEIAK